MRRFKSWKGIAGGVALAIAGPAGLAVGHEGHPVGEPTHPKVGALFGTITDAATGTPIDEVCVLADRRWGWGDQRTRTSNGGHYFFDSLRPGGYVLRIDPNCQNSPTRGMYAYEWYADRIDRTRATNVKIVAAQTTVTDVALEKAGRISLHVTDETGAAVDTCVALYPHDVETYDVTAPDRTWLRSTSLLTTRSVNDGEVVLGGLREGSYRLLVGCLGHQRHESPAPYGYIPRWTQAIEVAPESSSPIYVSLTRAGVVTGSVRDQDGVRRNARLYAYATAARIASYAGGWNGVFTTGRLSPGMYRMRAVSGAAGYFDEWYDGHAETFSAAAPVEVTAGAPTTIRMSVIREIADFSISELTVTDPEVRTVLGSGPNLGLRKDIAVTVEELNDYPYWANARLCIWAESRSSSSSQPARTLVAGEYLSNADLAEPKRFTYSWTPTVAVGDLRIRAILHTVDGSRTNNERVVDTWVGASGLGGVATGLERNLPPTIVGYGAYAC